MDNLNEAAIARDAVAELNPEIGREDRQRFATVLRGYDRPQVDECLARIAAEVASLRAAARDGSQRPQPPPSHAEHQDATIPTVAGPDVHGERSHQPPGGDGFGARLEKIMNRAEQEAAEIRADARQEARALAEQARAAAAERERVLGQQRRRAEAEIAELRSQADEEIARAHARAAEQLDRLRELETAARGRLRQVMEVLAAEVGPPGETSSRPERSLRAPRGPA